MYLKYKIKNNGFKELKKIPSSELKQILIDLAKTKKQVLEIHIGALIPLTKNKEFPKEIWTFTNLEHLNLDDMNISNLPLEIAKLNNLKYLSLNKNKLSSLPNEINNLINSVKISNVAILSSLDSH